MKTAVTPAQFWAQVFAAVRPSWWADADRMIAEAEPRRKRAKFNTGSISQTTAVALRALVEWMPTGIIIAEVGTFIGVSTHALAIRGGWVSTCDVSNDCLDGSYRIAVHPYQTSTQMLQKLQSIRVHPALFFFDGLLSDNDIDLILSIAAEPAVYVFDDYNGEYKGVQNVRRLAPRLKNHVLMPADGWVKDQTTLAVLVPEDRL